MYFLLFTCASYLYVLDSLLHLYDLNTLEFKMTLTKSKGTSLVAFDIKVTTVKYLNFQTPQILVYNHKI